MGTFRRDDEIADVARYPYHDQGNLPNECCSAANACRYILVIAHGTQSQPLSFPALEALVESELSALQSLEAEAGRALLISL